MTTTDDAPTLAERYGLALSASNLRTEEHRRGPTELLASAAWASREGEDDLSDRARWKLLGFYLFRLNVEYDRVRGEVEAASRYVSPLRQFSSPKWEEAKALASKKLESSVAQLFLDQRVLTLEKEASEADEAARKQAPIDEADVRRSARAYALLQLRDLGRTKEAMLGWAVWKATKMSIGLDDETVGKLVGPMLDAWLNPKCSSCNGTGYTGQYGTRRNTCRECGGQRDKRQCVGRGMVEQAFANRLLMEMTALVEDVEKRMKKYLGSRSDA